MKAKDFVETYLNRYLRYSKESHSIEKIEALKFILTSFGEQYDEHIRENNINHIKDLINFNESIAEDMGKGITEFQKRMYEPRKTFKERVAEEMESRIPTPKDPPPPPEKPKDRVENITKNPKTF